jgi:hypothetical protein
VTIYRDAYKRNTQADNPYVLRAYTGNTFLLRVFKSRNPFWYDSGRKHHVFYGKKKKDVLGAMGSQLF